MHCEAQLPHVIRAIRPAGALTRGLYGRQQKTDEDSNDGNDHQEFDERETVKGPQLFIASVRSGQMQGFRHS